MSIRVCQNSFSRGILSPTLQGRVDLEQYNLGLKKLVNGFVAQEGCVLNRAGLEFINEAKYSDKKTRLIPFSFSLNQNYVIEMGDKYFRFIKDGGYILDNNDEIYEVQSPFLENELFQIDYVQQADVITFVHKNHKPQKLSRIDHNNWTLDEVNFKASINPPQNVSAVYTGSTSSNTRTYEYVVCAIDATTKEESNRSQIASVLGHLESYWTTAEYITISWDSVDNALEYNVLLTVFLAMLELQATRHLKIIILNLI